MDNDLQASDFITDRSDAEEERKASEEYVQRLRELEDVALKEFQPLAWGDRVAALEYIGRQIAERLEIVEFWRKKRNDAAKESNARERYQRRLRADIEDLNLLTVRHRVLDGMLSQQARASTAAVSDRSYKGDVYAEASRPYIESATSLNHAYAIGYASRFDSFDEEKVAKARSERDIAKGIQSAWETAGYLDKSLDPKSRLEELKRRIFRFVDEGMSPPRR